MTDAIQRLTARLAAEPDSLAFLELAEALRHLGRLDAAVAVTETGLRRYPSLAPAWDLLARIRADRGEGDAAFDAWTEALRCEPRHPGALRGLAYLAFRAGDFERAERQLQAAVEASPDDPTLQSALERVRQRLSQPDAVPEPEPGPDAPGTMLCDSQGRLLAGRVQRPDGVDASDAVAAELAGVSREAARAARLLDLGAWRGLSLETADANMYLLPPTDDALLLALADPSVPAGRVARAAERAAEAARRWLERRA